MARMDVVDINHKPEHVPYYLFIEGTSELMYIVHEDNYDKFINAPSTSRLSLSAIVLDIEERTVTKSRFF